MLEFCKSCQTFSDRCQIRFVSDDKSELFEKWLENVPSINKKEERDYKGKVLNIAENELPSLLDFSQNHGIQDLVHVRFPFKDWEPLVLAKETMGTQWIEDILQKKRVRSFYQPIVNRDRKVVAHEILSRFLEQNGTLIPPMRVFQAARRRNRIFALDRMCRMTGVRNSVNLSGKIFINFMPSSIYSSEHCLRSTLQAAEESGVDPSNIVFEVVESEKIEDIEHLKSILAYYRKHGFRYALDDVGQGFSTLELSTEITPDFMKLDMKYVQGVSSDPKKQEMAAKMLETAKRIQAIPLAEGIEAWEDYHWLWQIGYELFQGYLFGKPEPCPEGEKKGENMNED